MICIGLVGFGFAGLDIDNENIRKYEMQKLLYYFAVVTCTSVRAANTIYDLVSVPQLVVKGCQQLTDFRRLVFACSRPSIPDRLAVSCIVRSFTCSLWFVCVRCQCDNLEFEASSNQLDLSFVPDGFEIPTDPHEVCTEVPAEYKPPSFFMEALQSTKVRTSITLQW